MMINKIAIEQRTEWVFFSIWIWCHWSGWIRSGNSNWCCRRFGSLIFNWTWKFWNQTNEKQMRNDLSEKFTWMMIERSIKSLPMIIKVPLAISVLIIKDKRWFDDASSRLKYLNEPFLSRLSNRSWQNKRQSELTQKDERGGESLFEHVVRRSQRASWSKIQSSRFDWITARGTIAWAL